MEFNGVFLHFADKPIFVDLNLTIRSGECLVLLGPSGTTGMTHIAIQENLDGKVVEWMEKVTDDQYRK